MKRLRNLLLYFLTALALVVFFTPKRQLYYLGETVLQPYGVVLSGEFVDDRGFSLALENGTLYYQDLKIAKIGSISILPLLFFNRINVASFALSDETRKFVPGTIDHINVYQSVVDPLNVHLSASGGFGQLSGRVNLRQRKVHLSLSPSAALLKSSAVWLREFKKQASGEYLYESTF